MNTDSSSSLSREELKKKLREQIKGARNNNSRCILSQQLKKDPQSTLMSLGIDDANILKNAKDIVKNPQSYLQNIKAENREKHTDEDDEDVPPEQLL